MDYIPSDADRRKIENIVAKFETFCVGSVNVTYERYRFNKCIGDDTKAAARHLISKIKFHEICQKGVLK